MRSIASELTLAPSDDLRLFHNWRGRVREALRGNSKPVNEETEELVGELLKLPRAHSETSNDEARARIEHELAKAQRETTETAALEARAPADAAVAAAMADKLCAKAGVARAQEEKVPRTDEWVANSLRTAA